MFKRNLTVKVISLLVLLTSFMSLAQAASVKYPSVQEWKGKVWLTGKDGKRLALKKSQVLREKALIQTDLGAEVKVQIDPVRRVTLFAGGEVSLPVIGWKDGEVPVLLLNSGQIRWQQALTDKGEFNLALRSALFEFIAPPGDYILSFDPAKAGAGVKVFQGKMEFSVLNGEESVSVGTGQQVFFQGEIEEGEIVYDVLLKGRKIPRGKLGSIESIESAELAKFAPPKKAVARRGPKTKAKAETPREGSICQSPSGRFNECSWVCMNNPKKEKKSCLTQQENVFCSRRRCNANGEWADEFLLDAEKGSIKCKARPVVGPCDY